MRKKTELVSLEYEKEKYRRFYFLLSYWLEKNQIGESIITFFSSRGIGCIAIYGMQKLGELLYRELSGTEVEVKYVIDRNTDGIYVDVPVVKTGSHLDEVDAIVVTAVTYFDEIKSELGGFIDCPVISLEEIIYGA